jgi:hypothetical protein
MQARPRDAILWRMEPSYGVVWREGAKPLARGKLELLPRGVHLDGMTGDEAVSREIAYDLLSEIHIGRSPEERVNGQTALVLEPRIGAPISIASVAQAGILAEIAERLAELQIGTAGRRRVAIVLPLLPGSGDAVRALLADGPPFDPEQIRLDRHEVLLTSDEAIFLFESRLGANALDPLLEDPALWERAAAWHEYLAGPPRIAEDVFSWTRDTFRIDESLLPPGLRNGG